MKTLTSGNLPSYQSPDFITVKLWLYTSAGQVQVFKTPMPNTDQLVMTFWEMTYASWNALEKYAIDDSPETPPLRGRTLNPSRMKTFYLRHMLRSWNFEKPQLTRRPDGALDDESFNYVMHLHPAILRELGNLVFRYTFTDSETRTIQTQCNTLFARGEAVSNPHEYISLYCTLTSMWKNFGLNYFDLKRLPLKEQNALKMIVTADNQIQSAKFKQMENKAKAHSPSRRR